MSKSYNYYHKSLRLLLYYDISVEHLPVLKRINTVSYGYNMAKRVKELKLFKEICMVSKLKNKYHVKNISCNEIIFYSFVY